MKISKNIKKIALMSFIMFSIFLQGKMVMAAPNTSSSGSFWSQASEWYSNGETNTYLDESVLKDIASLVEVMGTGVIAIATVVIGVKYVLGSVENKASAKENLITLLIACIFFFGWSNIRSVIITGVTFSNNTGAVNKINGSSTLFFLENTSSGIDSAFKNVFGIVLTVAQIIAVLATAYMGVKYVFSGAEQKAKLKEKSISYIIGIIMIFTTLNFLKFVSGAIDGAFK